MNVMEPRKMVYLACLSVFVATCCHILFMARADLPRYYSIVDLSGLGPAPDQFRVVPYMLIELLRQTLSVALNRPMTPGLSVFMFTTVFLFLSNTIVYEQFSAKDDRRILSVLTIVALVYPISMLHGFKIITPFVLFINSLVVWTLAKSAGRIRDGSAIVLIALLSFSRADTALFMALFWAINARKQLFQIATLTSIPIASQFLLSFVLFPRSEYYTKLIMLQDNLSLRFISTTPLSYLILGTIVLCHRELMARIKIVLHTHPKSCILLAFYLAALTLIARIDEYRLFIPLLPVILYLSRNPQRLELRRADVDNATEQA